jgi:ribosomal protein S18 acetylase RimI-like enzyme
MVATTVTVCERARYASPFGLGVQSGVTDQWLDAFMRIEKNGEDRRRGYENILNGIGPASCFVLVSDGAEDVGLGIGVAERGWAGIFCVATDEQHRRQGVARQVMSALADWSREAGARNLYLQVMTNNVPAVTLYSRLGFSHLYYYHYREK